jgi:hypothetical protein
MSFTPTFSVNFMCSSVQYSECLEEDFFCASSIIVAVSYFGGKLQTPATIFQQLSITFHIINKGLAFNRIWIASSTKEKFWITAVLHLF